MLQRRRTRAEQALAVLSLGVGLLVVAGAATGCLLVCASPSLQSRLPPTPFLTPMVIALSVLAGCVGISIAATGLSQRIMTSFSYGIYLFVVAFLSLAIGSLGTLPSLGVNVSSLLEEVLWTAAVNEHPVGTCLFMQNQSCVGWTSLCQTSPITGKVPSGTIRIQGAEACPPPLNRSSGVGCAPPVSGRSCHDVAMETFSIAIKFITLAFASLSLLAALLACTVSRGSSRKSRRSHGAPLYSTDEPMVRGYGSVRASSLDQIEVPRHSQPNLNFCCCLSVIGFVLIAATAVALSLCVLLLDPQAAEIAPITSLSWSLPPVQVASVFECPSINGTLVAGSATSVGIQIQWRFSDGGQASGSSISHEFDGNCGNWSEPMTATATIALAGSHVSYEVALNVSRFVLAPGAVPISTFSEWDLTSCSGGGGGDAPLSLVLTNLTSPATLPFTPGSVLVGLTPSQWTSAFPNCAPIVFLHQVQTLNLIDGDTSAVVTLSPANSALDAFEAVSVWLTDISEGSIVQNPGSPSFDSNSASSSSFYSIAGGSAPAGGSSFFLLDDKVDGSEGFFTPISVTPTLSTENGITGKIVIEGTGMYLTLHSTIEVSLGMPFHLHKGANGWSFGLGLSGGISASLKLDLDIAEKLEQKFSRKLKTWSKRRFTMIGDVPTFFTVFFNLKGIADAAIRSGMSWEGQGSATAEGSVGISYTTSAGMQTHDSWSAHSTGSAGSFSATCHAKVMIGLQGAVGVSVDGMGEVDISVEPEVGASVPAPDTSDATCPPNYPPIDPDGSSSSNGDPPSAPLGTTYEADLGFKLGVDAGLAFTKAVRAHWTPYSTTKPIATGCLVDGPQCEDMYVCQSTYTCVKDNLHGTQSQADCQKHCPWFVYTWSKQPDCTGGGSEAHTNPVCVEVYGGIFSSPMGSYQIQPDPSNPSNFMWTCYSATGDWCTFAVNTYSFPYGSCVDFPMSSCGIIPLSNRYHMVVAHTGPMPTPSPPFSQWKENRTREFVAKASDQP